MSSKTSAAAAARRGRESSPGDTKERTVCQSVTHGSGRAAGSRKRQHSEEPPPPPPPHTERERANGGGQAGQRQPLQMEGAAGAGQKV
ncbi:hypothetical protein chiPu_0004092 [Chiloscyllium punctatum]|uniref:Uncharacterized protein n=1 Tax=Chiloscyllium punctatum TaxID=137246 RepID=A0A401S5K6_CHIPU|nr:hypothetical protein [Chiloscyllium punctatum]